MAIELRKTYVCDRCGHDWLPQDRTARKLPPFCPKCGSRQWNGGRRAKLERDEQARRDYISEEW